MKASFTLKTYIKQLLSVLGLEVMRVSLLGSSNYRLMSILDRYAIHTIFDVGANTGQFAMRLRESGYSGSIISFEPLSSAHEILLRNSKHDPNWIVGPRLALSNFNGSTYINISKNSVSSSLNSMLPIHELVAPQSKYIGQELVNVKTFESILSEFPAAQIHNHSCLLKIDTQGHEYEVLEGCGASLEALTGLLLELSIKELYESEKNMLAIFDWLGTHGFELWSLSPAFVDKKTCRILQYDCLFINTKLFASDLS